MTQKIRPRHPEKVKNPVNPIKKKPEWIRSKLSNSKEFFLTKTIINKELILNDKLKLFKHKITLIRNNDLDYLDMLYRETLKYGTKDEILIKLK